MLNRLDSARHASRDQPDGPSFQVTSSRPTGARGRPRKDINREWLAQMSTMRDKPGIASVLGVSTRTLRRRELELGISLPGVAFVQRHLLSDGTYDITYNSQSSSLPALNDTEVDSIVASHLEIFPNFGRSMIIGSLLSNGQRLTRKQLRASYDRLQGGPTQTFSNRRIHRRTYQVAGPNSLWHHDGQHGNMFNMHYLGLYADSNTAGLIRYKLVIHAFVDGFSRYVTGIQVVNNNRAATVSELFDLARAKHGTPSRVRGDHGVENIEVANTMEEIRGSGRGSYIWGR
jgi:hypothetical protein